MIQENTFSRESILRRRQNLTIARRFQEDPVAWVRFAFGVELWSKQQEILYAIRDHKRVAVRSGNDVGKTFSAAVAALWMLFNFPPCAVITTAPTFAQVRDILWREIHKLWGMRRPGLSVKEPDTTQFRIAPDQFAIGLTTNQPERFQGYHEKNIFFILDEASGIDAEIYDAIEGSMQSPGAKLLMIGNPTRLSGPFYEAFYGPRSHLFYTLHISQFDYVEWCESGGKYKPPLVTREDIEERRRMYGEGHPYWAIRVLGEFPAEPPGTLIPLRLIDAAQRRVLQPVGEKEFGIDVADKGGDETVVCCRQGDVVLFVEAWNDRDTEQSVGRIVQLIEEHKPARVKVDYPGVGAAVYNPLRAMQRQRGWRTEIIAVHTGARSTRPDEYRLVSDELWFELAQRFREGRIDLSHVRTDDLLREQLVTRTYELDRHSVQYLESKHSLRARNLPSPDRADALALAFYTPARSKPIASVQIRNLYG